MIADFATVWPNVGPIVLESDVCAKPNFACSAFVIFCLLRRRQRRRRDLERCSRPGSWRSCCCSTFWTFASPWPLAASTSRTAVSSTFFVSATLIRVPDSKSMPKLMPFDAERERADEQDRARGAEEPLRVAHVVQAEAVALLLARAERRRVGDQPRLAHRAEDRLRREHRREQRDDDAEAERQREALDARGREHEQDERDHDRHDVRVDDRRQALLVARRDARHDRSARHGSPP